MGPADTVIRNIASIYERRRAAVYALCLSYAARALNKFRADQPAVPGTAGKYWNNQTGQAAARVFANAAMEENVLSWFMAHAVQYGVYLELANDRKHEALRPIIQEFIEPFTKDLRELYVG
jgi:uncharacterized protein (DUF2336 family)